MMAIHVDDCIVTGSCTEGIQKAKSELNKRFKLTDMGTIGWVLGITVTRDCHARTLSLSQQSYIKGILVHRNFSNLTPRASPMDCSQLQSPTNIDEIAYMSKFPYRHLLGILMWANVTTCPDITFAMSMLAQFLNNPG